MIQKKNHLHTLKGNTHDNMLIYKLNELLKNIKVNIFLLFCSSNSITNWNTLS